MIHVGVTKDLDINYLETNPISLEPFQNAERRAQALFEACQPDFDTLTNWFGVSDGFGPDNRIKVVVQPDSYARNDGKAYVTIDPFENFANQEQADDAVQSCFVAEVIEILMNYRNGKTKLTTWHLNQSDGEGLSRVAAATLHPVGYYNVLGAPFVNTWLQSNRPDYVNVNDPTDIAQISFGCAILFIYYLRDQLGFSMSQICQSTGANLGATYQALTGANDAQPFSNMPFLTLLNKYLPFDPTPGASASKNMRSLITDNPFPILESGARNVRLGFQEIAPHGFATKFGTPANPVISRGTVDVSPFFMCPARNYQYEVIGLTNRLRCIASVNGFAQPKFTWKVNGDQASTGGSIFPTATVLVDDPSDPMLWKSTSQKVHIGWTDLGNTSTYVGVTGELDLDNPSDNHAGHEQLTVEVQVSETFGTSDTVSATAVGVLDTQEVLYEPQFYGDREACLDNLYAKLRHYVAVNAIPLVFTLPDPAPELRAGIRMLKEIVSELEAITARNGHLGGQLSTALAQALDIPERMMHALTEGALAR